MVSLSFAEKKKRDLISPLEDKFALVVVDLATMLN